MVTEQEELSLAYLLDPAFQLINTNGKPLTGGWIECYIHGTRNKYYCYSDWNGNLHPFRIPLDSIGSNVVLADPNRAYDVYVYNRFGSLVMSRYNVSPGHASGASVGGSGDAGHWIARLGSTIQAPKNQYSTSIPIPANPDYEGDFVDRINGNNIYLKEGVYLVDAILRFRQNPDDLSNTFGDIHVFTGVDDSETVVYNRNETGPDADETDYHQIRVQFVRHVTGNTDDVVCFQVKSTNALSWIQIQNLSIVKLGGGSGIAPQPVEYSAGQYISIENDEISVTGLQPSGNYATVESVSQGFYGVAQQINTLSGAIEDVSGSIPSIEGLASETYVDEHIEEAVSGKADRSEIPSLDGYATEQYVQSQVSGKADKSEIPSLDGYATETYVQSAVSGKQDVLEFTYDSDNKITSIDGHGIAGTGGGGGSGAVYTPGQYISIQNDIISVTGLQPSGEYLTQDDLNGYATDDDVQAAVSGKADKSEIPSLSGYATEQYVQSEVSGKADKSEIPSLDGYATQEWIGEQNFATVDDVDEATSGKLDSSAYTAPVNADWNSQSGLSQILNKPEASQLIPGSGISIVPSGDNYIINSFGGGSTYTEGEYIKIENDVISVTGLQPSGQYLVPEDLNGYATTQDVEAATSGKADVSAIPSLQGYATEQYVQDQTSGFVDSGYVSQYVDSAVSGKQDALQFTYNEDDKISAINGSAIAGGSEVPIGVMTESGLKYNAVGEISGYGESAIAQYGAEKQWLVHDDTLVHAANSAQYALGVNLSAVAQLLGVDETVLWEGTDPLDNSCLVNGTRETATLSEPLSSFNKIRIYAVWNPWIGNFIGCNTFEYPGTNQKGGYIMNDCTNQGYIAGGSWSASGTTFKLIKHWQAVYGQAKETANGLGGIFKIIGIGRKQSN